MPTTPDPFRADALFAIAHALSKRPGDNLAARVAAEVVLAQIERSGLRVVRDPTRTALPPGVAPRG